MACAGCGQRTVYSRALLDAARKRDGRGVAENLEKMRASLAEDAKRMMGLTEAPRIDGPVMLRVKKPPTKSLLG